jgi:octaprenyl-diphosphate synthase
MPNPIPLYQTLTREGMQTVDAVIRRSLHSDVVLIRQMADYIVASGGKRLRPTLVLLAGSALSCADDKLYTTAAMIEFIHTATLLHDDVVDESEMRRGRQTANAMFGNAASVLVGDFLYSRAFQMMVASDSMRVVTIMSNTTNVIAEGEVLQLLNIGEIDLTENDYLQVIRYKTAKLFESAAQIGAVIAGANPIEEQALADYGLNLGVAFQIVDDILDYTGDAAVLGKSLGDDLGEGKVTLPLIYAMRHGSEDEKVLIANALKEGDASLFPQVLAAVRRTGALDATYAQAQTAVEVAIAALAPLPDTPAKTALIELAQLSIQRNH